MIYFPLRGSSRDQGTVLYRIKNPFKVAAREFTGTRRFDQDTVEQAVVLLPYEPNCLVSFINTPEAVHSTNPVEGPPRRYIFSCMQTTNDPGDAVITVGERAAAPTRTMLVAQ
jgi:hypothetical protein